MSGALRHRCRNPHCRLKLREPVENEHHAFCARGCFESFYRARCLVCEEQMRRKTERQRIKSGHKKCEAEYRKFPHAFSYPPSRAQISDESLGSAHSTGTKFGIEGHPPRHRCLRGWWWGDPGIGDLPLSDKKGLTLARIVLEDDGRYHLRPPITWPRMSWRDLGGAKHRAESLALSAIPLESFDPKLAARIKRENETPHPMGPPLNRQSYRTDGAVLLGAGSKIAEAKTNGGDTSIPDFLRRAP